MFLLDSLLIGSLRFVLDKLLAAAEAEARDDTALREQLLVAQMRLDDGDLTEEQFREIETMVFTRIREIKAESGDGLTLSAPGVRISGIEASVSDGVGEE